MKLNLTLVSPSKEGIGGVSPGHTTAMLHPSKTAVKKRKRKVSGKQRWKSKNQSREARNQLGWELAPSIPMMQFNVMLRIRWLFFY